MENETVKKKSTLVRDAIALFLITLISGLALSFVNEVTRAPIEQQKTDKANKAYSIFFADAEFPRDEELTATAIAMDLGTLDPAFKKATINSVNQAVDKTGNLLGYIVVITTKEGYKPPMTLAIGYTTDHKISGIEYIKFSENKNVETVKGKYTKQYIGVAADKFAFEESADAVKVDAVSKSTVSSKAILNAVNAGIGFLNKYADLGGGAVE